MIDLDLPSDSSEQKIKNKRNEKEQPLLVIMPLDPRVSPDLNQSRPLIGFGLIFPDFDGEESYEYAARPMQQDFEDDVQDDDDQSENE